MNVCPSPLKDSLNAINASPLSKWDGGWGGTQNGELLALVQENEFEVFLTSDQNLGYQQNLEHRTIPLLVLPTNHWPILKTKGDEICAALDKLSLGDYVEMSF
jgi:hypothetical protein